MNNASIHKRQLNGIIVSNGMKKSVVVRVDTMKNHPKYHKKYRVSKKYKSHDETSVFKVGDTVTIVEWRPISKTKKWRVLLRR